MKKRLKGLVSLWLAVVMVCGLLTVPAMAEEPKEVLISTSNTDPVANTGVSHKKANLLLDDNTPLTEQPAIMNVISPPEGSVLKGWKLWNASSGGYMPTDPTSQPIDKNGYITTAQYTAIKNNDPNYNYPLLQPVWEKKYQINPQPQKADPTVGGEIYDEAATTWSKTDNVTYQWCKVTTGVKTYKVADISQSLGEGQIGATKSDYNPGSYADGAWNSAEVVYADGDGNITTDYVIDLSSIPVETGDKVTVTFSNEISGRVNYDFENPFTGSEYVDTVDANDYGSYSLSIVATTAFTATITVTRDNQTIYTDLTGQTSKTLDLTKIDAGTYACRLTFDPTGDKVVMVSNTVTYDASELCTVTYDLNGGTGAASVSYDPQKVLKGTEITVKEDPSKTDNKFLGWFDGEDYYMLNGTNKITVNENITLIARWVPLFTVTLNWNDQAEDPCETAIENIHDGESANTTFNRQNNSTDLDAGVQLEPSRTGYTFDGWYTDKDVWAVEYDFNTPVTENITVFAKWAANSYTVQFHANGGNGTMADQSFIYDVAQNLTSNAFTRDGYTFIGWAENESGQVVYTDGQSVKNLTAVTNGTVDLYAKWEEAAPPVVDPPVIVPPVVISGIASLTKVDAEDTATVLPGVVFELYKANGTLNGTYTTNAFGQITVYGLMPGTYYWRETRPAEGYILDSTEHVFTVYEGQISSLVVKNERSSVPEVFSGDHYAYIIGRADGLVHPLDNITRAEFAAIAARFDAHGNTSDASFTDIYDHWAKKEINIAANNGWVLGYEDDTFRPDQFITRAEAMTMVNRVLQRIPQHPNDLLDYMVTWTDNMDTSKWYYLMVQEATNSHDYHRKESGYEYWTGLRQVPDWAELER